MGALSPVHWLIIVVVVLLLLGSKKLPDMARGVGQSMRILKAESRALREDGSPAPTSEPDAPAPGATGGEQPATDARPGSATAPHRDA